MFVGVKFYRPPFTLVFPREFVHTLDGEENCGHSLQAFVFQFAKSDSILFLESNLFGQDWPKDDRAASKPRISGNLFAWWVTLLIDVFFPKSAINNSSSLCQTCLYCLWTECEIPTSVWCHALPDEESNQNRKTLLRLSLSAFVLMKRTQNNPKKAGHRGREPGSLLTSSFSSTMLTMIEK